MGCATSKGQLNAGFQPAGNGPLAAGQYAGSSFEDAYPRYEIDERPDDWSVSSEKHARYGDIDDLRPPDHGAHQLDGPFPPYVSASDQQQHPLGPAAQYSSTPAVAFPTDDDAQGRRRRLTAANHGDAQEFFHDEELPAAGPKPYLRIGTGPPAAHPHDLRQHLSGSSPGAGSTGHADRFAPFDYSQAAAPPRNSPNNGLLGGELPPGAAVVADSDPFAQPLQSPSRGDPQLRHFASQSDDALARRLSMQQQQQQQQPKVADLPPQRPPPHRPGGSQQSRSPRVPQPVETDPFAVTSTHAPDAATGGKVGGRRRLTRDMHQSVDAAALADLEAVAVGVPHGKRQSIASRSLNASGSGKSVLNRELAALRKSAPGSTTSSRADGEPGRRNLRRHATTGHLGGCVPPSHDGLATVRERSVARSQLEGPDAAAELPSPPIRFQELEQYHVVGTGQFGSVRLVRHIPTGQLYALKVLHKAPISAGKQVEHVINERRAIEAANHPLCVRHYAAFQDARCLYLLQEFVCGGELLAQLEIKGVLHDDVARFYAACVITALAALHERGYVYRDLKPENLLLDASGYVKMADFGFAKHIGNDRTYTICGTPDYQAPEVIHRKGTSYAADWWGVGVLLYEMLTGEPPFKSASGDPWDTFRRVLAANFELPDYISPNAADLISQLLQVDVTRRLGCGPDGVQSIRNHAYFDGLDWASLEIGRLQPPVVPPVPSDPLAAAAAAEEVEVPAPPPPFPGNQRDPNNAAWQELWDWVDAPLRQGPLSAPRVRPENSRRSHAEVANHDWQAEQDLSGFDELDDDLGAPPLPVAPVPPPAHGNTAASRPAENATAVPPSHTDSANADVAGGSAAARKRLLRPIASFRAGDVSLSETVAAASSRSVPPGSGPAAEVARDTALVSSATTAGVSSDRPAGQIRAPAHAATAASEERPRRRAVRREISKRHEDWVPPSEGSRALDTDADDGQMSAVSSGQAASARTAVASSHSRDGGSASGFPAAADGLSQGMPSSSSRSDLQNGAAATWQASETPAEQVLPQPLTQGADDAAASTVQRPSWAPSDSSDSGFVPSSSSTRHGSPSPSKRGTVSRAHSQHSQSSSPSKAARDGAPPPQRHRLSAAGHAEPADGESAPLDAAGSTQPAQRPGRWARRSPSSVDLAADPGAAVASSNLAASPAASGPTATASPQQGRLNWASPAGQLRRGDPETPAAVRGIDVPSFPVKASSDSSSPPWAALEKLLPPPSGSNSGSPRSPQRMSHDSSSVTSPQRDVAAEVCARSSMEATSEKHHVMQRAHDRLRAAALGRLEAVPNGKLETASAQTSTSSTPRAQAAGAFTVPLPAIATAPATHSDGASANSLQLNVQQGTAAGRLQPPELSPRWPDHSAADPATPPATLDASGRAQVPPLSAVTMLRASAQRYSAAAELAPGQGITPRASVSAATSAAATPRGVLRPLQQPPNAPAAEGVADDGRSTGTSSPAWSPRPFGEDPMISPGRASELWASSKKKLSLHKGMEPL